VRPQWRSTRRRLAAVEQERAALAEERAAFRRVATFVTQDPPPSEIFATVAAELGGLLRAEMTHLHRYEGPRRWTVVGAWSETDHLPLGLEWTDDGGLLERSIVRSGRPARIDDYELAMISIAPELRRLGARSSVGAPIVVDGRVWGMIAACSRYAGLPFSTEPRLTDFSELVGSAVASAESRLAHSRLADAQAALRRVATLVAREPRPAEVFTAVAEEARCLTGSEVTAVLQLQPEGGATIVAGTGAPFSDLPPGSSLPTGPGAMSELVRSSGRPARVDRFDPDSGALAAYLHRVGVHSAVGAPILVDGRLWGVLLAGSSVPLPANTEARLTDFAELAAVAISNADTRAALAGSRARIVSAADETRRRIERDLHDGIQQRLVSLGLELRDAQFAIADRPREAQRKIDAVADGLTRTLDDLREISRGIHPAVLAGGLGPALKALARRSPVPVELDIGALDPVPQPTQVAAYYVVSEAFTNAAKHGHASVVRLLAERDDGTIRVAVTDDGIGGADPARGSGLIGLSDRIGAIGGRLAIDSAPGRGTSIVAVLPAGTERTRGPARRGGSRPAPAPETPDGG
jgi:signal transduction histidine kinase